MEKGIEDNRKMWKKENQKLVIGLHYNYSCGCKDF